jgi:putative spermidine/putrescine transport system substrate-binding protein
MTITRRTFVGGVAGFVGLASLQRTALAAAKPSSPLTLSVVDVAGNLALTQKALEAYAQAKPDMVARFVFSKAPAPELPAKIKAQQGAGRVDIDLVLTGTDALSAGLDQDLWVDLAPHQASRCRRSPRTTASA